MRRCHSSWGRPTSPLPCWLGGCGEWQRGCGSLASCAMDWAEEAAHSPLVTHIFSRSGPTKTRTDTQPCPEPRCSFSEKSLTPNGHVSRVCLAKEPEALCYLLNISTTSNKLWGVTHTLEMKILLEFPVCNASFGRHRFSIPTFYDSPVALLEPG